jgi:3-deoxy-manno-octulosonate cytidylyltransferase (CMP-KDO synthetase)
LLINKTVMKFIGIIPARYDSTRFPGKPLAIIQGKTMIQRVYEQAKLVLDHVFVATDDQRIMDAVQLFGAQVIMTSKDCQNGTQRCLEAYQNAQLDADVVVNIQGDEPFLHPEQLVLLMNCFENENTQIATLVKKIDRKEELEDVNIVKVVRGQNGQALYFSRQMIPFVRNQQQQEQLLRRYTFYKHVGIYAYNIHTLEVITELAPSPAEQAESLEQLRWLEHGFTIQTAVTTYDSIGIDTPEDIIKALDTCTTL